MKSFKIVMIAAVFFLCIGTKGLLAEEVKVPDSVSGGDKEKEVHKVETEKGVLEHSQQPPISGSGRWQY